MNLEAVKKGPGSRQEGLDMIATMLHSTLAVMRPDHPYWELEGYDERVREMFIEFSTIWLARNGAEPLFEELEQARFDEPRNPDPTLAQPETSLDMMDDAIDCLRYLIRAAGWGWVQSAPGLQIAGLAGRVGYAIFQAKLTRSGSSPPYLRRAPDPPPVTI